MNKEILVMGMFVADLAFKVARIPEEGETLLASDLILGPGGKGSNQAVAAAKLGGKVTFLTRVGADAFADMLFGLYDRVGINRQHLIQDKHKATGAAAIAISETTGHNSIIVAPGPAANINKDDLQTWRPVFAKSDIFVTQMEANLQSTFDAIRMAKSMGLFVVFNPAPAFDVPSDIYRKCDLITPNEIEAGQLLGCEVKTVQDAEKATTALLQRGCKSVCLTLGDQGVVVNDRLTISHIHAHKTDAPVIDTSGAGDCFTGCLVARLAAGDTLLKAAEIANKAASISVTRPGTAASMPDLSEVSAH